MPAGRDELLEGVGTVLHKVQGPLEPRRAQSVRVARCGQDPEAAGCGVLPRRAGA